MNLRAYKTIAERLRALAKKTGTPYAAVRVYPKALSVAQETNCENMIGAVQIPLGVAGPLVINGEHAAGSYIIPLATTEGALVASINRGCKAISSAGGAVVVSTYPGMTRGPVFRTRSLKEAHAFASWLQQEQHTLGNLAKETSAHLTLVSIQTKVVGSLVFARFSFHTGDAMGMNMATFATQHLVSFITRHLVHVSCIALAGNFDIDKKPAWLNSLSGRGYSVWAQVVLSKDIVSTILKTNGDDLFDVWVQKCMVGGAVSGSLGYNAHVANMLAAMFLACGQDPAHVAEGSIGITTTEKKEKGAICVSLSLPDLPVGIVGGGTKLPAQKEMLSLLASGQENKHFTARAFAEIVCAVVLAGEISLLSSLAQGSLARAHKNLARKQV